MPGVDLENEIYMHNSQFFKNGMKNINLYMHNQIVTCAEPKLHVVACETPLNRVLPHATVAVAKEKILY